MSRQSIRRRAVLLAAGASLAGLAGCTGDDDSADEDDSLDDAPTEGTDEEGDNDTDDTDDTADDGADEPVEPQTAFDVDFTVDDRTVEFVVDAGDSIQLSELFLRGDLEYVSSDVSDDEALSEILSSDGSVTPVGDVDPDDPDETIAAGEGVRIEVSDPPTDELSFGLAWESGESSTLLLRWDAPDAFLAVEEIDINYGEVETAAGSLPRVAEWIDPDAEEQLAVGFDTTEIAAVEEYSDFIDQQDSTDDPIEGDIFSDLGDMENLPEGLPITSGMTVMLFLGFLNFSYPLVEEIDIELDGDHLEGIENPVAVGEQFYLVQDVLVLFGEVDADRLEDREEIDQFDTHGDYTLYESEGEFAEEPTPLAASDSALVFPVEDTDPAADPEEILRGALDRAETETELREEHRSILQDIGQGGFHYIVAGEILEQEVDTVDEFAEFGLDEDQFDQFRAKADNLEGMFMTADSHDGQRVSRSGFLFRDDVDERRLEEFIAVMIDDSEDHVAQRDGLELVVETFWS